MAKIKHVWSLLEIVCSCKRFFSRTLIGPVSASIMTIFAAVSSADAQTCAQSPEDFVRVLGDQIVAVMNKGLDRDGRKGELEGMFLEHVAVEAVGRTVLGRFEGDLSDSLARSYLSVFSGYISSTYAGQLAGLSRTQITVESSRPFGGQDILVSALFHLPNDPPLNAGFRVRCLEGEQKLMDAIVQGVSLLTTKRDEFVSFLRSNSIEALIAAMERVQ